MKYKIFAILFLLFVDSYAQDIDQQFSDLIKNNETFKNYKVIKIEDLNSFQKMIQDSSNLKQESIAELITKNNALVDELQKVKAEVLEKDQMINDLNLQISTISVVGLEFDKTVFKVFVFSTMGALLVLLIISFIRLKERMSIANSSIKEHDSLQIEFDDFKKDTLEKQMKLRRELQTERNRQDEKRNTV